MRLTDDLSERLSKTPKESLNVTAPDISYDCFAANEKLIMILNKISGLAPYSHEFSKSSLDPQIISGFISAMATFMGVVMGGQQTSWKTEYGAESMLLVEHGAWAIGVLLVSRETTVSRTRLRNVVREFEDCFAVLRDSDGIEGSAFGDFDRFVRRAFVNDQVTGRTLVSRRPETRDSPFVFDLPSTSFSVSKILLGLDETRTVKEVADFLGIDMEQTIDIVSQAYWHDAVFLKYVPPDDEILILSQKSSAILFQKNNPLGLSNVSLCVAGRFDGRTSVSQLTEGLPAQDLEVLLDELGTLFNRGVIQRISSEQRRVLHDESILSSQVLEGARIIGNKSMKEAFETIRRSLAKWHPRVYRVTLTDRMHVRCILEESMTPDDLSDLADALESFIEELDRRFSTTRGRRITERFFHRIRSGQTRLH